MVNDALYLVVPLFKWYLSFLQSCILTECVYSWGPQPQSSCKCAEEVTNIFLCMSEACGPWWKLTGSPSLSSKGDFLIFKTSVHTTGQSSSKPRVGQWGNVVSSWWAASCWRFSINYLNWASPRSLRAIWKGDRGLSWGWGLLGGDQKTTSLPGIRVWAQEGCAPLSAT